MKKLITRNTNLNWLLINRFIHMPFELIVGIMLARYLGPDGLGKLSFAVSLVTILSILSTLGLDNIVIKHIVEKKQSLNSILGTALFIRLSGSVAIIFLANLYSIFRITDITTRWIVFFISIGYIFQCFKVIDLYFQAIEKCKFTVISQKISVLTGYSLKLISIFKQMQLLVFAQIRLLSDLITAVVNIIFFQKYNIDKLSIKKWNLDLKFAKILLLDCWPLAISGLAAHIYIRLDQILLHEFIGSTEVGIYSASVRILNVWYFVTTALGAAFYPKFIKAKLNNPENYKNFIQSYYILMFWIALIIVIFMSFTGEFFVTILYGEQYALSTKPLLIAIWSLFGTFLGMAINHMLIIENKMKIVLFQTILGSLLNLLLNIFLIPKYLSSGAAIATVISYTLSTFSFLFFKETWFNVRLLLNVVNPKVIKKVIKEYILT